mgnify:CR=1 FL=1
MERGQQRCRWSVRLRVRSRRHQETARATTKGLRRWSVHLRHDTACHPEHPGPSSLCQRRPHRSTPGLQPDDRRQETNRAGVWLEQTGRRHRQLKTRGQYRVEAVFRLHVVAYNMIRLAN